jgi:hypothetical protein
LNRDPIEEDGGLNVYAFAQNDAINSWDLMGLWTKIERDVKKSRVATLNDKEPFTIHELAEMVKLDRHEALGESGWLRSMTGRPVKQVRPYCWYTVPNEAHITQGDATGDKVSQAAHKVVIKEQKAKLIKKYKGRKYRVIDHNPSLTPKGQSLAAVKDIVSKGDSIYVWAHYGHGVKEHPGNLMFISSGAKSGAGPEDLKPSYKLFEIVLFSCWAGAKREAWRGNVSGSGKLWATKYGLSPLDTYWGAYSHLSDKEEEE